MKPIVFIGMMGSGKTTIGQLLAQHLNKSYIDIDQWIEADKHMSITEMFKRHGEAYFRQCEVSALKQLINQYEIISPGGGIILNPINCDLLKQHATVIYLTATPQTLFERISTSNRPLLQEGNIEEKLSSILSQRQSLYEQTAHFIIETDGLTPNEVLERIHNIEKE